MSLQVSSLRLSLVGALFLAACGSAASTNPPGVSSSSSGGPGANGPKAIAPTALSFVAPCSATSCGSLPSHSTAPIPTCASTAGSCAWAADEDPNNATVSYSPCEESKCGTAPDASVCPAGTTFKGAACGSENDGACLWRSACSPPPSTTPCADPDACGPKTEIGIICKDGTVGDQRCMQQGATCGWEPTCE